jgi:hypothetical protein
MNWLEQLEEIGTRRLGSPPKGFWYCDARVQRGRVVERYFRDIEELITYRGRALHESERSLLALLELQGRGGAEAFRKAA